MITIENINLGETEQFSPIFLDYINQKEELKPFYNHYPTVENFKAQIEEKDFSSEHRKVLHSALVAQYQNYSIKDAAQSNVDALLSKDTYTVTTGHQLNIFTGPLYFIYKIVTTINLSRKLQEAYPTKRFVPIYWAATEDHDFDEISYFNMFNKTFRWITAQKGAVGTFELEGLRELLNELPDKLPVFEEAYTKYGNLADAVRYYINELFGAYGVVMVDGNDKELKRLFSSYVLDEFKTLDNTDCITDTSEELLSNGYKAQVFPRDINFFYLKGDTRERFVERVEKKYHALHTDFSLNDEELKKHVSCCPEEFSPNVIMRPMYQEVILPNLAYIGGPGELAYWLQLKSTFDRNKIPFPILFPRNFALYINKNFSKKIEKLAISSADLFKNYHELRKGFVKENADVSFEIQTEKEQLLRIFEQLEAKAKTVDPSLSGMVGAEEKKMLKSLLTIEKKTHKAEENKQEVKVKQLEAVYDKLFPAGGLQERHDNFMNYALNNESFVEELLNAFDPFNFSFYILKENA